MAPSLRTISHIWNAAATLTFWSQFQVGLSTRMTFPVALMNTSVPPGAFGRKNDREVQLGASTEIVVDGEIDAPVGDLPGLAGPEGSLFINGARTIMGSDKSYRLAVRRSFIRVAVSHWDPVFLVTRE